MLLTDGSIHLFIQSVSEEYNTYLPTLITRTLRLSLSLSLFLANDLGEHGLVLTLSSTVHRPLTSGHVKYLYFTQASFLACLLFVCFTISHQYNKTFYNPSTIYFSEIFIQRYYCLQRAITLFHYLASPSNPVEAFT